MYRIKGLYEVTERTVPFVFSDKEIAKFKLLYGSVATSLDAYIREELFQVQADFEYRRSINRYSNFIYNVPDLRLELVLVHLVLGNDLSSLDLEKVIDSRMIVENKFAYNGDRNELIDGYNGFLESIDSLIKRLLTCSKKVYSNSILDIYLGKYSKDVDIVFGLGRSKNEVLFSFTVDKKLYTSEWYGGVSSVSDIGDKYQFTLDFNKGYRCIFYISKSNFDISLV